MSYMEACSFSPGQYLPAVTGAAAACHCCSAICPKCRCLFLWPQPSFHFQILLCSSSYYPVFPFSSPSSTFFYILLVWCPIHSPLCPQLLPGTFLPHPCLSWGLAPPEDMCPPSGDGQGPSSSSSKPLLGHEYSSTMGNPCSFEIWPQEEVLSQFSDEEMKCAEMLISLPKLTELMSCRAKPG